MVKLEEEKYDSVLGNLSAQEVFKRIKNHFDSEKALEEHEKMESVLISIKPKWCELIANGKKTIEVRKTRPKIETPFKCYIYCTKGDALAYPCANHPVFDIHRANNGTIKGRQMRPSEMKDSDHTFANRKVIGEFVCDKCTNIFALSRFWLDEDVLEKSCLTLKQIRDYCKGTDKLYGWHISDLKIYEEPKSIGEFNHCGKNYHFNPAVTRPPQSWCYVKESKGGKP